MKACAVHGNEHFALKAVARRKRLIRGTIKPLNAEIISFGCDDHMIIHPAELDSTTEFKPRPSPTLTSHRILVFFPKLAIRCLRLALLSPSRIDSALGIPAFQGPESVECQECTSFRLRGGLLGQSTPSEPRLSAIVMKVGSVSSDARFVLAVLYDSSRTFTVLGRYCSGLKPDVYSISSEGHTSYQAVGKDPQIWDRTEGNGSMSVSPVVVPRDGSEERGIRLTLVALADILRDTPGLAKHIAEDNSISVLSCSGFEQIGRACTQPQPCLVVADASILANTALANTSLVECARVSNLEPSIKILIIVEADDPGFCQKLLRMGFMGSIQRSAPAAVFRRALDAVAQGELWASRKTISALVQEFLSETSSKRLTSREKEILGLVAKGHKNREIASLLLVSHETIRWHLRGIYSKLGIPDRRRAIEYALRKGITVASEPNIGQEPQKGPGSGLFLKI
jgi:two-component system, NarL family, response regulator NreC